MITKPVNKSAIGPIAPVKPLEGIMAPVQAKLLDGEACAAGSKDDPTEKKIPDFSQTTDLADNIQNNLNTIHNIKMNFSVHEASGQVMVAISDEKTGELIREIPSLEILNLAAKLDEMVGLLFDQKG